MSDGINWRVLAYFALAIGLSCWGSIAAYLLGHDGEAQPGVPLTTRQLALVVLRKLVVGGFTGILAALLAQWWKLGVYETCILAAIAGYTGKEFLEWAKDRVKGMMTNGSRPS
jgi:hypothetical protein